jgi:photosystem II stability/assembly factor-like uncharacterized protein
MKKQFFSIFLSLFIQVSLNAQWVQQVSGTTADLGGISFLNANTGFICGSGVILKTTNGGINWVNINTINLLKPFKKIQALDSNFIYCVGMFSTIIKSTNGGLNWQIIRNGPSGTGIYGNFFALFFINTLTGWIGGDGGDGFILKTTNGGITMDSIPVNNSLNRVQDFNFANANTGLVCGTAGTIKKTTDGGYGWVSVNIPTGTWLPDFNNFSFINNNTGFTCTHAKQVYKTTDFGNNWDSLSYIPNTFPTIHHICFSDESKGWAVGSGYDVFHTTNGGLNWYPQGGMHANGILFINDSVGWKAGNVGVIYKTTNGGVTTTIGKFENKIIEFELFDIYPNPFNNQTTIKLIINKSGHYKLELFNIRGKSIKSIIPTLLNPGIHRISLNTSGLATGVYFLKLSNANKSSIKKLILLK